MSLANTIPEGTITAVAQQAGVTLRGDGPKHPCRCPFHEDRHASAFVDGTHNRFHCARCTPGSSLTAKQLAESLGVAWPPQWWPVNGATTRAPPKCPRPTPAPSPRPAPTFGAAAAAEVWAACTARARDDATFGEDSTAYDYLGARGLLDSWEEGAFGITPPGVHLPGSASTWRERGYHIVVPLFDAAGAVSGVQARSIRPDAKPKTLCPKGSRSRGLVFANRAGVSLLRGASRRSDFVLLGEGLTDALAYCIAAPGPSLCSPGTGMAAASLGAWIAGQHLVVAMDADAAGQGAIEGIARAAYAHGVEAASQLVWPDGIKDACDMLADQGANALADFLDTAAEEARHG